MNNKLTATLIVASAVMVPALTGCFTDVCAVARCNAGEGGSPSTSTITGGGGGASANGGGGEGGGGVNPACIPGELTGVDPLPDTCAGVFVMAGATGTGTRAAPFGSIGDALGAVTPGGVIYVCTAGQPLVEAVAISSSVVLYGGLDCTDWSYTGEPSVLEGPSDLPAMHVTGSSTAVTIADLEITAAAATVVGGSSVAMFVEGATADLDRVTLTAGVGASGAAGTSPGGTGELGGNGTTGNAGCTSGAIVAGPTGVPHQCGVETSTSGRGGDGTVSGGISGNGTQGDSDPVAPGSGDNKGLGQTSGMACTPGTVGTTGAPGTSGAGALATAWGALTPAGYFNASGMAGGSSGHPGQGGGGGGGARGATVCVTTTNAASTGGSGGAGGCGGEAGTGGGGGGSSVALAALNATIALTDVVLTGGAGGDGGDGNGGQSGGSGGNPGFSGGSGACSGGQGGQGGTGGAGGGGRGGHSLGLLLAGTPAPTSGFTFTPGSAGAAGAGGDGGTGNQGGAGVAGAICSVLDVDAASCTP